MSDRLTAGAHATTEAVVKNSQFSETFIEQLRRVEMMARTLEDENGQWDLSVNDCAALKALLAERQSVATCLRAIAESLATQEPRRDCVRSILQLADSLGPL